MKDLKLYHHQIQIQIQMTQADMEKMAAICL